MIFKDGILDGAHHFWGDPYFFIGTIIAMHEIIEQCTIISINIDPLNLVSDLSVVFCIGRPLVCLISSLLHL